MKKLFASCLAVVMAGAMLAGCGDSDSSSKADTASEAETTTTTTAKEEESPQVSLMIPKQLSLFLSSLMMRLTPAPGQALSPATLMHAPSLRTAS